MFNELWLWKIMVNEAEKDKVIRIVALSNKN